MIGKIFCVCFLYILHTSRGNTDIARSIQSDAFDDQQVVTDVHETFNPVLPRNIIEMHKPIEEISDISDADRKRSNEENSDVTAVIRYHNINKIKLFKHFDTKRHMSSYNYKETSENKANNDAKFWVIGLETTEKIPLKINFYAPIKLPRVDVRKYVDEELIKVIPSVKNLSTIDKNNNHKTPSTKKVKLGPKKLSRKLNEVHVLSSDKGTDHNEQISLEDAKNNDEYVSIHNAERRVVADQLAKEVRILCWLYDSMNQHLALAAYVKQSWGKRCNVLLLMSNHTSLHPPYIRLRRNNATSFYYGPTKEAFKYAYDYHRNDADWFVMVDYTTFFVVENLRHMLSEHRSTDPIWILSRGGLDRFIQHAENRSSGCAYDDQQTNMFLKYNLTETVGCLENIGVEVKNTSDQHGCTRFFELELFSVTSLAESIQDGFEESSVFNEMNRCKSELAVAFVLQPWHRYIAYEKIIREIYYLIYHLRPFGITRSHSSAESKIPPVEEPHVFFHWLRFYVKSDPPVIGAMPVHQLYSQVGTALSLAKEVRVLCWVMTYPDNHRTRAANIKATWGKRCNVLLFMSTQKDPSLPTVSLPVKEGRDHLWDKTRAAFKYIHKYHRDDADWFLKADDDTYVIVENLRYMLSGLSSSEPLFTGCWFKPHNPQGYMSGGAGYVLSRRALDLFVNLALPSPSLCEPNPGAEDIQMGRCLSNVGVKFKDSRDALGRARFLPFIPAAHLSDELMIYKNLPWYWDYLKFNASAGINCCSEFAITFHYVTPTEMHEYDYFLYKFRLFGVSYDDKYLSHQSLKSPSLFDILWNFYKLISTYLN